MTIENFLEKFVDQPTNVRTGKYATIFLLRKAESECIFRTDGPINNELTHAGMVRKDLPNEYYRVFLSKRKQIAPERRSGREILRKYGLSHDCEINKKMCGECIDCRLYGTAVGTDISYKSRVVSDESFSILPYSDITVEHTFNALYENGTMFDDKDKKFSQSINSDEVVKFGALFLDMETISDVTMDEFTYVLANVLRTKRYGAMSSRLGKVRNIVIGIAFSNCELFSNLEWTQRSYDNLCIKLSIPEGEVPQFPLDPEIVIECVKETLSSSITSIHGEVLLLNDAEIQEVLNQINEIYSDDNKLKDLLSRIDNQYHQ